MSAVLSILGRHKNSVVNKRDKDNRKRSVGSQIACQAILFPLGTFANVLNVPYYLSFGCL
jgi:hypothetical protein